MDKLPFLGIANRGCLNTREIIDVEIADRSSAQAGLLLTPYEKVIGYQGLSRWCGHPSPPLIRS